MVGAFLSMINCFNGEALAAARCSGIGTGCELRLGAATAVLVNDIDTHIGLRLRCELSTRETGVEVANDRWTMQGLSAEIVATEMM